MQAPPHTEPHTHTSGKPPGDRTFTLQQLAEFDGSNPDKPIYVGLNRIVFDVSSNRNAYGPGNAYNLFAGKEVSRALGKSILKSEACVPDMDDFTEDEKKSLEEWVEFYQKRYDIVGRVII